MIPDGNISIIIKSLSAKTKNKTKTTKTRELISVSVTSHEHNNKAVSRLTEVGVFGGVFVPCIYSHAR